MNKKEIKKQLLDKARELAATTPSRGDIEIEAAPELFDGIQNISNRELALEIMSRNWAVSNAVKEALGRLEDGSYGTCLECEEEINPRRLAAIPWAKYCVTCQAIHDREEQETSYRLAA